MGMLTPKQIAEIERGAGVYYLVQEGGMAPRVAGGWPAIIPAPPPSAADEASLREGLRAARGEAHWIDIDRVVAEIYETRRLVRRVAGEPIDGGPARLHRAGGEA